MKKVVSLGAVLLMVGVGCSGSNLKTTPSGTGGKITWQSENPRPDWTLNEPEIDGNVMMFVGLSNKLSTEKEGRTDALRNVSTNVVKYLGTLAKDKFERASVTFGLTSSVVDPTESTRHYEKQLAANVAKKVKPKKWYIETWDTPTGDGWKVFVLATIPVDSLNESFRNTAKQNMQDAKRKAKEAADDVAKKQAENAAEFWAKMAKEGVVE